jgi:hypothetical protein
MAKILIQLRVQDRGTNLLDPNIQSRKIIHAALLLLILEAASTDLV